MQAEVEEEERVAAELARREKENTKASQGTLAAKQGRAKGKTQPGAHGGEEKSLSRRPDRWGMYAGSWGVVAVEG